MIFINDCSDLTHINLKEQLKKGIRCPVGLWQYGSLKADRMVRRDGLAEKLLPVVALYPPDGLLLDVSGCKEQNTGVSLKKN